ncbi:MAG TPA: TROVE domain-containing protein [Pricia antarctica]|uniref:TROVE domain-containing protein n=1 Tax=Pricia antarctica TaxID=641691 RepID=A0A831QQ33_9FLAO|nr:TROVE domain-containing protein [Pricia antarctica]
MKTNVPVNHIYTHEGAVAKHINVEQQLRRSVMSCLLWEAQFYEDGVAIADRIAQIIPKVGTKKVAAIAIEAREKMKLRHMPLLIVREMARIESHKRLVSETLSRVIQRPDELSEFCAIYWKEARQPLSAQVKKGLAAAFGKFNEYSLSKYDRDGRVKLRDVLFLCHAKPKDKEQDELWKRLIDGKLAVPDTWEVSLSGGNDISKKDKWERLLKENKLGALALLRNLRNMEQENVDMSLVKTALQEIKTERVLPFRFIAAAQHAPQLEPELEAGMLKCLAIHEKLPGKTVLMVDISGSMDSQLSDRSQMRRFDAACGLAMLLREICDDVEIFSFSYSEVRVPPRRGFALRDAIVNSQEMDGTYLGRSISSVMNSVSGIDRIIVITDEQSHDRVPDPVCKAAYMVNVASYKNGIGYGAWTHIDGWSEAIIAYIQNLELSTNEQ